MPDNARVRPDPPDDPVTPPGRRVWLFGVREELRRAEDRLRELGAHNAQLVESARRLAADNTALRRRLDDLRGPGARDLEAEIVAARAQLAGLHDQLAAARTALARTRCDTEQARADAEREAREGVRRDPRGAGVERRRAGSSSG